MTPVYTVEALATGEGRNGHVATNDGHVDLDVRVPEAMGGSGGAANPEALFAAGYAACFHSALLAAARMQKVKVEDTSVGSRVHFLRNDAGGFELAVELEVIVPNLPADQAQQLADAAHTLCPYSNATRGNIDVKVTVSDD